MFDDEIEEAYLDEDFEEELTPEGHPLTDVLGENLRNPWSLHTETAIGAVSGTIDHPLFNGLIAQLIELRDIDGVLDAHVAQIVEEIISNLQLLSTELILRPAQFLRAAARRIPASQREGWWEEVKGLKLDNLES